MARLLFMGNVSGAAYETRNGAKDGAQDESAASLLQTGAASVEHNGTNSAPAGRFYGGATAGGSAGDKDGKRFMTEPQTNFDGSAGMHTGHELDAFLGKAFDEKPVWQTLYENVRDVFFPVKLPPLQLTSTPIAVPDRMAVKANPWAIGISSTLNIAIILFILWLGIHVVHNITKPPVQATNIDVGTFDLKAPKAGV